MKNNKLKLTLAVLAILPMLALSNIVFASETTGTLTTGITATNGSTVNGVVIASPVANPVAGSYASAQSVGLTADGATSIYYTTDGTTPTCSSGTLYSGPITVSSSLTISAISCYPQNNSSTSVSYTYTINIPVVSSGGGGGGGGGGGNGAPVVASVTSGTTGISNFVALMSEWGQTGLNLSADFNKDGKVDILDFIWLMANWTK